MLNFKLDLVSPLFLNVKAYRLMSQSCQRAHLPHGEALSKLRALFPDLNNEQFLEIRYEYGEMITGKMRVERHRSFEYLYEPNRRLRRMFDARQSEEFYRPAYMIQHFGRGLRKNGDSV